MVCIFARFCIPLSFSKYLRAPGFAISYTDSSPSRIADRARCLPPRRRSFSKGFSKDKKASSEGEKRPWQPLSILNKDDDGPANKKRALRRQRAQTKPYFDAVTASKVLWNELREKKCPEAPPLCAGRRAPRRAAGQVQ